MDNLQQCRLNSNAFWKRREWDRYTNGDYIYDLTDSKVAHCLNEWIRENAQNLSLSDCEQQLKSLWKVLHEIRLEDMDTSDIDWFQQVSEVKILVNESLNELLSQWTELVHKMCGEPKRRNDYIFSCEYASLAYWRSSVERKNKMIFFPGVQIEVPSFLQSLRIEIINITFGEHVSSALRVIRPGEVFSKLLDDSVESPQEITTDIPTILTNEQIKSSKKERAQPASKKLVQNIDALVKKSKKKKKKKATPLPPPTIVQPGDSITIPVPPGVKTLSNLRCPSTTRADKTRLRGLRNVSPFGNQDYVDTSRKSNIEESGHLIDFNHESFLGQTYHFVAFKTGSKPKQCGAWLMHSDTALSEYLMKSESMNISLKVPVEESFLGQSEPIIAFSESYSDEWKKGVYTMHAQFDQTIFAVNSRLSKFGRVALFQQSDSHFPYRRWSVDFKKDSVDFKLHTGSVEIKFVLKGLLIHLETQTGDELSKLRTLHQKQFSMPEMTLQRQGVFIFPQEEAMRKQRNTRKNTSLEEYCYRLICLKQINCCSCRLNATSPEDTVVVTCGETNMQVMETAKGTVQTIYSPTELVISKAHENNDTISSLFRWFMLTRPLSMTK